MAAGQVVTLAGGQAVAVQAAASITLAALLWPLIPAAGAVAAPGQRAGPMATAAPGPGAGGRGNARIGRCRTGRDGARSAGVVYAADAVTLGVEEEFVLLDPATGATVLAAPDLVRMLGGEPGVRQELMRFQWRPPPGCAPLCTRPAASCSGSGGWQLTPRRSWAAAWWPPGLRRTAPPGWPR
jgi:hypothetical protein